MHGPSGLSLTLSRAYSSSQGRFINRDSVGESQGLNLFDYLNNDPANSTDPSGLGPNQLRPQDSGVVFRILELLVQQELQRAFGPPKSFEDCVYKCKLKFLVPAALLAAPIALAGGFVAAGGILLGGLALYGLCVNSCRCQFGLKQYFPNRIPQQDQPPQIEPFIPFPGWTYSL